MGTADTKPVIKTERTRNANFELLRIVCMFMIVLGHSMSHTGLAETVQVFSFNWFLVQILQSLIVVEVNCYVLISGYFLCESIFKPKRVFNLWITAIFWSVLLTVISLIVRIGQIGFTDLLKACLTVTSRRYWFVTSYILMYLFVPFLNNAIRTMDQRKHASFLIMYFSVFIVLQNFAVWDEFTLTSAHSPLFFIFLYMTAAYIRKYPPKKRAWLLYYFCSIIAIVIWKIGITAITYPRFGMPVGETLFSGFRSIPGYLASIFLFLAFKDLTIKNTNISKSVLRIAPMTFGVYLIHDHTYIRDFLWGILFPMAEWKNSAAVIPGAFVAVSIIFIVCILLEYIRKKIVAILRLDNISEKICSMVKDIWERIVLYICG